MMNLATTLAKKGQYDKGDSLVSWEERAALLHELDIPEHQPLVEHLNIYNVVDAKPILEGLAHNMVLKRASWSSAKARGLASAISNFLIENEDGWRVSAKEMCARLEIPYIEYLRYCQVFPDIWRFVSLVINSHAIESTMGRVHQATANAAIHGDHRDRRLYLELAGKLRRGGQGGQGGGVTLVFMNDNIQRPQVIEAEASADEDQA